MAINTADILEMDITTQGVLVSSWWAQLAIGIQQRWLDSGGLTAGNRLPARHSWLLETIRDL
jgi:hypothetical protein